MMNPVTLSPAARARSGPTEEFEALCKTLYGEAIDPDEVWDEVIKLSPDQADVHAARRKQRTKRILEGTALASTVAGGALGLKEGIHGAKQVFGARRAGKLVPKKAYASLLLAGAATGGDGITTGVLATQNKHGKKETASKMIGGLPPMARVIEGHTAHMGSLVSATTPAARTAVAGAAKHTQPAAAAAAAANPTTAKTVAAANKKPSRAYRAGKFTQQVLSSREGQAGLATGAVGATGVGAANRGRKNYQESNADYGYESYYGKADDSVVFKGVFSEIDEDQRTAFGWASVTELGGQPVVDRQGDYITTEDIEKAAYDYVHKSRVGGDMHRRTPSMMGDQAHKVSDMIESVVFTDEKIAKMGLPEDFPRGWWVGFKIHDDETWDLVKKGERTGFSIHGKGIRKDLELDSVMGYN